MSQGRPIAFEEHVARLYDHQLRSEAVLFPNAGRGRADSAAYLDRLFHELVGLAAPTLFVEAGAYRADASRRIRIDHPQCQVVAFEANPHNHAAAAAELEGAGVDYRNVAVTREPGVATFQLRRSVDGEPMRKVTGNSSLLRRTHNKTEYDEITVRAVSLDSEFGDHRGPSALWVDVEGASGPLLEGASTFLRRCQVIMIEVEEHEQWEGQWLSLDVLTHLLGEGFVPLARDIEYENQFNLVLGSAAFCRRAEVLLALELHQSFLVQHLSRPADPA